MKPKVLITSFIEGVDYGEALRLLEAAGCEVVIHYFTGGLSQEELRGFLPGIDAVIAASDQFSATVLEAADSLRVISRLGAGYDTIDIAAASKRGIVVTTVGTMNAQAVADLTMGMLITLARRVVECDRQVRAGIWTPLVGVDVHGKTLGIVGLGAIGKEVAKRAGAFDLKLLAHDVVQDVEFATLHGVTYVSLDELLTQADFVSIHSPLSESTRALIGEQELRLMKSTAYLINTARGAIVDEDALFRALSEGWIAGAALDVFAQEPPWGSPLLGLENVVVTSHVGATTKETMQTMALQAAQNVICVLQGQNPKYIVNPEALRNSRWSAWFNGL